MVRAVAALAVTAVVALVVFSGRDDGVEAQQCMGLEPFEFDTLEAYDNAGLYLAAIELAAEGEAVTSPTTPAGEPHGLEYPGLLSGSQAERIDREPDTSLRIPPTLLKAIVWVESEFCARARQRSLGRGGAGAAFRTTAVLGWGQITDGDGELRGQSGRQASAGGDAFVFNLAEAARMLAEKVKRGLPAESRAKASPAIRWRTGISRSGPTTGSRT